MAGAHGKRQRHARRYPCLASSPSTRAMPAEAVLAEAARVLRAGGLVAFPTETVYGLGALALDESALARVYEAKGRPAHHPLIAHVEDESAGARARSVLAGDRVAPGGGVLAGAADARRREGAARSRGRGGRSGVDRPARPVTSRRARASRRARRAGRRPERESLPGPLADDRGARGQGARGTCRSRARRRAV